MFFFCPGIWDRMTLEWSYATMLRYLFLCLLSGWDECSWVAFTDFMEYLKGKKRKSKEYKEYVIGKLC